MSENDSKGVARRRFIANKLAANGLITYAEIEREYPAISRQQLKNDARILHNSGIDIEKTAEGRNGLFFSPGSQFPASYDFRKSHNLKAKRQISTIAKFIAISKTQDSTERFKRALSSRIVGSNEELKAKVIKSLIEHVQKDDRKLYLDGGTTTSQIADRLLELEKLDREESILYDTQLIEARRSARANRVGNLKIWTNNRHVFYRLGHPKCIYPDIAIIGGYQLNRTAAICGDIAKSFVTKLMPDIDIAFFGASMISTDPFKIFMGNKEESIIKDEIMKKSCLNIVVADSSKFSKYDDGNTLPFLDESSTVDLIITNKDPEGYKSSIPMLCNRRQTRKIDNDIQNI